MCVYFSLSLRSILWFFSYFLFSDRISSKPFFVCVLCVSLFITSSVYSKQRKRLSTSVLVLNELNIDHVVRKMSKTRLVHWNWNERTKTNDKINKQTTKFQMKFGFCSSISISSYSLVAQPASEFFVT